jgi:molecular chaperone IbpA
MTKITSFDLTPFYRNAIGVDRLFDRIAHQLDHAAANNNYPPYNIVETGENQYEIQVAVAGFGPGEIEINVKDGELVITGEKNQTVPEGHVFRHQGISARKFVRTFSLAEYVEVRDAASRDGILTVKLERVLPESARPKTIAITYEK